MLCRSKVTEHGCVHCMKLLFNILLLIIYISLLLSHISGNINKMLKFQSTWVEFCDEITLNDDLSAGENV